MSAIKLKISVGSPARELKLLKPIWCLTEQPVNAIPTAGLILSTEGDALVTLSQCDDEIALCKPGSDISIFIDWKDQSKLLFKGVIVEQGLRLNNASAQLELVVKHRLALLESTLGSRVFSGESTAAIVSSLLKKQNIDSSNRANMNASQEQLIQFRCSDWFYVRRLLDQSGAWLYADFDEVRIVTPTLAQTPDHTLKSNEVNRQSDNAGKASIFEASWRFNDSYQPKALSMTAWDISSQKLITANAAPESLGSNAMDPASQPSLSNIPWEIGSSTSVSQAKLDGLAQSALQHLQGMGVQGGFQVVGSMSYRLGQTLALSGFGIGFDGTGIITAVSHRVVKEIWTTTLSLGMKGWNGGMIPLPMVRGLQVGKVAKFEDDPRGLGRLRVSLPVLGEENNTVWARLAMPYASEDGGFYFYPNPGDEVIVGFFDGDPCFPVIAGSMYNPINKALVNPSKDNPVKGIAFNDKKLLFQFDTKSKSAELRAKASVEVKADNIKLINE